MSYGSVLPGEVGKVIAVAADFPRRADLVGQKYHYNDPTLGPIVVKVVEAGEAMTSPGCFIVNWLDDDAGVMEVEMCDAATDRPCGVCHPDQVTLADGDLFFVIVSGRIKLKNAAGVTITAGNFAIPSTTDGKVGDGTNAVTQGVDFARMVEAFTADDQTKVAELLHELVG